MDDKSKVLFDAMAKHIVDQNFDGAHSLLAPWLKRHSIGLLSAIGLGDECVRAGALRLK